MTAPKTDGATDRAPDRWLAEMVRRVDPAAADRMLAPEFVERLEAKAKEDGDPFRAVDWDAESLVSAFTWDDTEEGFDFWNALDKLLAEEFGGEYPRVALSDPDEGLGGEEAATE